ncbi:unnamed protein product, partial [Allacma fusca]
INNAISSIPHFSMRLHSSGFSMTCLTFQSNLRIDLAIDTALAPGKESAKEIVDNIADEFEVLRRADYS